LSRSPLRRLLAVVLTAATLAALAALGLATPAQADPPLSIDAGNGFRSVRVENPDNPAWFVTVNVDVHLGFASSGDSGPEYASPASSVTDGPGAVRFQVTNQRLRVDFDAPAIADAVVNDFYPSPVSNPRDNTPNGPGPFDACTSNLAGTFDGRYKLPLGVSGSLYDDRFRATLGCASALELLRNPLHNASDFEPDASVIRPRADWTNIGFGVNASGRVVQRTFLEVRWQDGSLSAHTVLSSTAPFGP
jgi:hypothetical protein